MAVQKRPIKWAISSNSLGRHATHTLEWKCSAARQHGFHGIEIVYTELVEHAAAAAQAPADSARQLRAHCAALGLAIVTLNPLKYFEGNLSTSLETRLGQAQEWVELAALLGAPVVQMPSQFLEHSTASEAVIVPELRQLADLAAGSGITVAYEAVAFAAHNGLWQDGLRVVRAVDRPNFGLCLDTFHVHARIWGDAMAESGVQEGGDEALAASMREFVATCPRDKVVYMQLSDAGRFQPPLRWDSELFEGLEVRDPRLAWSRGNRPFPGEGYFPVVDTARTWIGEYGWDGWVSIEVFLREAEEEENGPEVLVKRAMKAVQRVEKGLQKHNTVDQITVRQSTVQSQ
ncbi:putative 4-hydroxyphenylpyruvate dioxygenase [Coniochaeta ligniaria NRRL 30616]|uniref:Putative 4-hydroxyphenylpyruvate dioxygenase n=1 Tax=Coniochaeta ligniaria NRRL 30616 TaxID=1408157 RepID=A0A1J7JTM0_9PEZI|nr:putative 4-hydroxyphenylpyruvate dioxygenase [Coniochaeta ligniaria NRRL 30616]